MKPSGGQSAIWGGATLGLIIGIVVGLVRDPFWGTLVYGVLIGTALGIVATLMGWLGDYLRLRST